MFPSTVPYHPLAVIHALGERLDAAQGNDAWARGHRAAALAMASELISPTNLAALEPDLIRDGDRTAAAALRRYFRAGRG